MDKGMAGDGGAEACPTPWPELGWELRGVEWRIEAQGSGEGRGSSPCLQDLGWETTTCPIWDTRGPA